MKTSNGANAASQYRVQGSTDDMEWEKDSNDPKVGEKVLAICKYELMTRFQYRACHTCPLTPCLHFRPGSLREES